MWFWMISLFILTCFNNMYKFEYFCSNSLMKSLLHSVYDSKYKIFRSQFKDFVSHYLTTRGVMIFHFIRARNKRVACVLALHKREEFKNHDIPVESRTAGQNNRKVSDLA